MTSIILIYLNYRFLWSSVGLVPLLDRDFLVNNVGILWLHTFLLLFILLVVDIKCLFNTFINVWFLFIHFTNWLDFVLLDRLHTRELPGWTWCLRLDSFEKGSVVIFVIIIVTRAIVVALPLRTRLDEAKSGGFAALWPIALFAFLVVFVLVGLAVSPSAQNRVTLLLLWPSVLRRVKPLWALRMHVLLPNLVRHTSLVVKPLAELGADLVNAVVAWERGLHLVHTWMRIVGVSTSHDWVCLVHWAVHRHTRVGDDALLGLKVRVHDTLVVWMTHHWASHRHVPTDQLWLHHMVHAHLVVMAAVALQSLVSQIAWLKLPLKVRLVVLETRLVSIVSWIATLLGVSIWHMWVARTKTTHYSKPAGLFAVELYISSLKINALHVLLKLLLAVLVVVHSALSFLLLSLVQLVIEIALPSLLPLTF